MLCDIANCPQVNGINTIVFPFVVTRTDPSSRKSKFVSTKWVLSARWKKYSFTNRILKSATCTKVYARSCQPAGRWRRCASASVSLPGRSSDSTYRQKVKAVTWSLDAVAAQFCHYGGEASRTDGLSLPLGALFCVLRETAVGLFQITFLFPRFPATAWPLVVQSAPRFFTFSLFF